MIFQLYFYHAPSNPYPLITHTLGRPPRGMGYEGFDCTLTTFIILTSYLPCNKIHENIPYKTIDLLYNKIGFSNWQYHIKYFQLTNPPLPEVFAECSSWGKYLGNIHTVIHHSVRVLHVVRHTGMPSSTSLCLHHPSLWVDTHEHGYNLT